MFRVACEGIDEPPIPQLSWPRGEHATCMRVPLEHFQRIELQRSIEQKLKIVEDEEAAISHLVRERLQQFGGR